MDYKNMLDYFGKIKRHAHVKKKAFRVRLYFQCSSQIQPNFN